MVELFGETFGIPLFKNKYAAVIVTGVLAGWLALGNWQAIWPVFGAANQLIASLVLIVASVYLMQRGRKFAFAAIPAVIMLTTTIAALVYNIYIFVGAEKPNIMLTAISIILIGLALFLTYTAAATSVKIVKNG